ncbi:MAG TPA: hypothetical protein VHZ32_13160 [Rhizomicrobium sp.]|nr:hypothetical protein [Rhizomicrobium sp.]
MPKFLTIGYGDEAGYRRTDSRVLEAAHARDAELKRDGAVIGVAGKPVQVRNPNGQGVETQNGAYMSSPLPIAGFAIIEASNLEKAIEILSQVPCAVAHGVVEIWPLEES